MNLEKRIVNYLIENMIFNLQYFLNGYTQQQEQVDGIFLLLLVHLNVFHE